MNPIRLFCMYLFTVCCVCAEITQADEKYLPFTVEMTADYTPAGESKPLAAGFRCVVLRMEDGRLLVDCSRRGIFSIPVAVTNAAEAVAAAKDSDQLNGGNGVKIPRMAMFLANRIVASEKQWEYVLRSNVVNQMTDWYLLYGRSGDATTAEAIQLASAFYSALPQDQRGRTAFVYMDVEGDKAGIQAYYDNLSPSIQAMPGYLSRGYSKSFAHLETEDSLPVLVQLASSGRILGKYTGLTAMQECLQLNESD